MEGNASNVYYPNPATIYKYTHWRSSTTATTDITIAAIFKKTLQKHILFCDGQRKKRCYKETIQQRFFKALQQDTFLATTFVK